MWREFYRFDLRFQLRQPLLWLIAFTFGAIALGIMSSDAVSVTGASGSIHRNAPVRIAMLLGVFSIFSMFVVTIFIAGAVLRDSEVGIADILFATPMRKHDYLIGRFLAGLSACLLIFLFFSIGLGVGPYMPWVDPSNLGSFQIQPYLWSFFVLVIPNLLFIGAFLMLLAATTRSMMMVYVGVIVFIVLWALAGALAKDINNDWIAGLVDPFGIRPYMNMIRYFSTHEANNIVLSADLLLTLNRVVWSGIALVIIGLTVVLFKPQRAGTGRRLFGKSLAVSEMVSSPSLGRVSIYRAFQNTGGSAEWIQFFNVLKFDAIGVFKSTPYLVILLISIVNFIVVASQTAVTYGTKVYPTTYTMIDAMSNSFNFMLFIIATFYAGELIFRERQSKIGDVVDAMPVSSGALLFGKISALITVTLSFIAVGVLSSVCIQLLVGGAPIEFGLYLQGAILAATKYVMLGILCVFFQVVLNNKFLGYLGMILLLISELLLSSLDLNHNLYNFAGEPSLTYSDMNGYGHFLQGWLWFASYWGFFCALLLLLTRAFWVRGLPQNFRVRLHVAIDMSKSKFGAAFAIFFAGFVGAGVWIFYNTNVLNKYETKADQLDFQVAYEKKYSQYHRLPHPRITDVSANVDIFPEARRVVINGHYELQNKSDGVQDTLRIQVNKKLKTRWKVAPAHDIILEDNEFGFSIWKLKQPLQPGDRISMDFETIHEELGFTNDGQPSYVLNNGTFFDNLEVFPQFGYSKDRELKDPQERRKRGLPEAISMPKIDDQEALTQNDFGSEADWINFETTISTSSDQIAIAPGYLQRTWESGGRRFYNYKMDQPMFHFFAFLSAKWELRKEMYKGVSIEVYHDKKHVYNVDRMIESVKKSLDYFNSQFTPYQHKQVRILEFPRYSAFAQSFANTIPFSEGIGFIADLRDQSSIDYVFYVTAHEMAHQWWGHQVAGANVQGTSVLSESLSQYFALMVMEKEYGPNKIMRFLRYELDSYLKGRATDRFEEPALGLVEKQSHIYYNKGALIFYRLRDEIGELALNRALKKFLEDKGYRPPPYPTTKDLLAYVLDETPKEKQNLVREFFEKIIFYDNRVLKAEAVKRIDGQWDVTMKLHILKLDADGKGVEKPRTYDEPVEVGIFSRAAGGKEEDEKILFLEKLTLKGNEPSVTITVKDKPFEVGVDPFNKLIDRIPKDNRKEISIH